MRTLKQKQEDAAWRQANYNKLTTQEKFDKLPPTGSERERKKLLHQLYTEEQMKAKLTRVVTQAVVADKANEEKGLKAKERRAKEKST